jgi:hypothetical protein
VTVTVIRTLLALVIAMVALMGVVTGISHADPAEFLRTLHPQTLPREQLNNN